MLKKRIIPCLDIKDGATVKGINFEGLRNAGDPVELARKYEKDGADELVFLDITATIENRKTFAELVKNIAKELSIPFTVGGGISTVEDVRKLLEAGADKISVNSSAVKNPQLISDLAKEFGSQCVVVAIDTRLVNQSDLVHIKGGREATSLNTIEWAKQAEALGAGEILLTSMDGDGTKNGFDVQITKLVADEISIPVIASGGAGSMDDFVQVFNETRATGALAASIFHFNEIGIQELKQQLKQQKIEMR
ncbi:imidazole glycerol phosphate synthase subunit HisF [Chryseobacterium indologenes]|uniref:imidazole glycerol phosphate synthase subunit HisF n=1 Tax=Chryseobacterium indologenes TaxID=253 RepID=UPI0003E06C8F|nr:imidazole glycerol phosphate synthase subunit HisF [Chryseobacterium indologenes]QPQ51274.1 imidazole glycerol phosphate synthase subunit HisF [Chryseobacterium indologenes]SFJ98714.1 cyclase [Chryseobacterium indologenes]SUX49675.1 Imidazole glycerol phosphate synthase subunit HisF [Chryseobacterium indologenes]VFA40536.1 Imidazole glycerol phosphate synthase subunit HisF [Chryseobacterium indologenes]GAE66675.1 imidazole glycerol phosphate synthase subunit HisF [Chryseobacterium indologen